MTRVSRSLEVGDRLRRLTRALLPPTLYRLAHDLWMRARPASRRPWRYLPGGWPAQQAGVGWDGPAVAAAYRLKWPAFREALQGTGPFGVIHEVPLGVKMPLDDDSGELLGTTFSYVLARVAGGRSRLSVLDWGGALGHYALIARASLPELELDYHVRELPEVCQVGRELMPDVAFHDQDDCLRRSYDLVFVSGTLECLPDWKDQFARLAGSASGYIYVTRVPVALRARSFVGLQRVRAYGYGGAIPFWVIARDELLGEARQLGLTLVREFVTGEEGDIPGAPERPFPCRGFLFAAGERAPAMLGAT